jgi:DNA-binding transcriptional regulator YiaG
MELVEYLEKYDDDDLQDNERFQAFIVDSLDALNLSDEDAARLIDVSRPTIKYWKTGLYSPNTLMREVVRASFLELIIR